MDRTCPHIRCDATICQEVLREVAKRLSENSPHPDVYVIPRPPEKQKC
jgi:hypothetical protein